ncbi:MAG: hypothetical protein WCW35_14585 [Bacteroidota bacterium]|jgi:predicted transcriptional regulator
MNYELLRNKAQKFIDDEQISMRELARRASIPPTSLKYFFDVELKRNLNRDQMRRLARAIDPFKQDLTVRSAEIFKRLRKESFDGNEISIMGAQLFEFGRLAASQSVNRREQNGTE